MRPSRGVATFALCVLVLLRGVGVAAEAWTANQVECCNGRHAIDQPCCPHCPMHHKHHRGDGCEHLQSCRHDARYAATAPPPPVAVAAITIDPPVAPAIAPRDPSAAAPSSWIAPLETPPF